MRYIWAITKTALATINIAFICTFAIFGAFYCFLPDTELPSEIPFSRISDSEWIKGQSCLLANGDYLPLSLPKSRQALRVEFQTYLLAVIRNGGSSELCSLTSSEITSLLNWDDHQAEIEGDERPLKPGQTISPSETYWRQRLGLANGQILEGYLAEAMRIRAAQLSFPALTAKTTIARGTDATSSTWTYLGPDNIPGHVEAFAFDPNNPNTIIVGSYSGGLWLSSNAGSTWQRAAGFPQGTPQKLFLSKIKPNLAFAVFATRSPDTSGLYRSIDGGLNWSPALLGPQASQMVGVTCGTNCTNSVNSVGSFSFSSIESKVAQL